jgi:hypothetical protein
VRAVCSRLLYPRTSRLPPPVPLAGPFSATAQCSVDSRTASMQDSEHAGMHTRDTAHSMQEMWASGACRAAAGGNTRDQFRKEMAMSEGGVR